MQKKILVVDDEPHNVALMTSRLRAQGYETATANDGPTCIQKTIDEMPDLIILDVIMPGMNGFETARNLKKDGRTQHIPIIMLTALAQDKDVQEGLKSGAECVIRKPFNPVDLLYRVGELLDTDVK